MFAVRMHHFVGFVMRRLKFFSAAAYSTPKSHTEVRDLTKEEWAKRLTPEQFSVCREQCTEAVGVGDKAKPTRRLSLVSLCIFACPHETYLGPWLPKTSEDTPI